MSAPALQHPLGGSGTVAVTGPLFTSRPLLLTVSAILWLLNLSLSLAKQGSDGRWHLAAAAVDLTALLIAAAASGDAVRRRNRPLLVAAWLPLNALACYFTALASTPNDMAPLAANALYSAMAVMLLGHQGTLRGFLLLTATVALVNTAVCLAASEGSTRWTLQLLFLSVLPAAIGTTRVLLRRRELRVRTAGTMNRQLDVSTRLMNARSEERERQLAATRAEIDLLFSEVAQARALPIDAGLAARARELAAELRRLLLLERSTDWLADTLSLAGAAEQVTVVAPPALLDALPEPARPAIVAATVLLAGVPARHPAQRMPSKDGTPAPSLHLFVEESGAGMRLTWRANGVQRGQVPALLWAGLGRIGTPRMRSDAAGTSIELRVPGAAE